MKDAAEEIVALCREIAGFAGRLSTLRRKDRAWYLSVEPLCFELEAYLQNPPQDLVERVFADPRLLAVEPHLHRFRAAFEFDREAAQAREILESQNPAAHLSRYLRTEAHWALPPALREVLQDCNTLLVAGSGPLPMTAFAVAAAFQVRVTMLERDAEAFELGARLIEVGGLGETIIGVHGDIIEYDDLSGYDAVFAAALLGVDSHGDPGGGKSSALAGLVACMRPGAPLITREPHGLGRLLYPLADFAADDGLVLTRHAPLVGPGMPYRSGMLVVRRLEPKESHAEASTLSVRP